MEKNSSTKRYVRTFSEQYAEKWVDGKWVEDERPNHLDKQINDWVSSGDVEIVSLQPSARMDSGDGTKRVWAVTCTVLYLPAGETVVAGKKIEMSGPPIMPKAGAKAPTVEVIRTDNAGKRLTYAQAGIFGIPEGDRLALEDTQSVPTPLFSPDFDIKQYKEFFGNVA